LINTKKELKEYTIKYASNKQPITVKEIHDHLIFLREHGILRKDMEISTPRIGKYLQSTPNFECNKGSWTVKEAVTG